MELWTSYLATLVLVLHLKNENADNLYFMEWLWGLNDIIHIKHHSACMQYMLNKYGDGNDDEEFLAGMDSRDINLAQ